MTADADSNATIHFLDVAAPLRAATEIVLKHAVRYGDDCPAELAEAIAYSVTAPGKRLRPSLVICAAVASGVSMDALVDAATRRTDPLPVTGDRESSIWAAAAAVELIHAYSLVHDDLPAMDDDDLRRGRPTTHIRFDEATAILAGDAMIPRAFELIATRCEAKYVGEAVGILAVAAGAEQLVGGQVADLAEERLDASASSDRHAAVERLRAIHRRKTGALISASLRLGALLAGGDRGSCDRLSVYGQRIGLAFQITDDLLDAHGDSDAMGKRAGKDVAAGKLTYAGLLGIEPSRAEARRLVGEAIEALDGLPGDSEPLRLLAHFILDRNH